MTHRYHPADYPQDAQTAKTGKVANDSNKEGGTAATQRNEAQRTPQSRHDRESQIGNNQPKMRGGSPQGSNTWQPPKKSRRGGGLGGNG